MKFADQALRDKLAAEYVLGTMSARARRRFQIYLRGNPQLRNAVSQWELRLTPLTDAVAPIEPPLRVWQTVRARLHFQRASPAFWENLSFWRLSSVASGLLALARIIFFSLPI
jgi:anti-sigma-K factor RskA